MFVHAAQTLGFRVVVLDPDPDSPAGRAADQHIVAPFADEDGLVALARLCGAVTTEFENVPAASLEHLARHADVSPGATQVRVCQHRVTEKQFFRRAGVACAPLASIVTPADLAAVGSDLLPGILKTAQLGYDGKGQRRVDSLAQLAAAWRDLGQVPCVLEKRLALQLEMSVLVARNAAGELVNLPVQQNLHRDGILAVTQAPGPDIAADTADLAVSMARQLAVEMDYVGVLCVELFQLDDGSLVANEMAPRPHNSGHYSIDACDLSQFDLQVRTLAGLPLVAPRQHSAAVMLNLLGDLWFTPQSESPREPDWAPVLALPGMHLHLYGKAEARQGRKMGHLTVTAAEPGEAWRLARLAAAHIGLPALD
jgi:5-(carboxyamino)imidazole ribonucleotide synthase